MHRISFYNGGALWAFSVGGNSTIQGAYGGVHSNSNLTVGASASIAQTATATGTYTQGGSATVAGFHGGGQPALYIPEFVTVAPLTSGKRAA